jgi:hypothetical protein
MLKPLWLPLALINTAAWIIRYYTSTPGKNRVAIIPRYDQGVSQENGKADRGNRNFDVTARI